MCTISSNFRVSYFRNQVVAWLLLMVFSFSFVPAVSMAQQPTATIRTLNGDVLVSGQVVTVGAALRAGDTIQTQAGALVVLELSDGSELHLGEKTQISIADLAQTSTGARVSRVKLLWGRIRAFLSSEHQIEGSSFDIETPNALIGVKFSEPDIEVSYSLEKAETVGIAHTVELLAKNLVTNEDVLVPVGSSVIITAVGMKVVAGIVGAVGSSGAGSTGTGSASTGSTGMSTGTITTVGVAAAAAGGVAAIVANIEEEETAESTGDLSGRWDVSASCVSQGCPTNIPCPGDPQHPECCGTAFCNQCCGGPGPIFEVTQSGNTLIGSGLEYGGTFSGTINSTSVSFSAPGGVPCGGCDSLYIGQLDGNRIEGTYSGSCQKGKCEQYNVTWTGTFMVTIRK